MLTHLGRGLVKVRVVTAAVLCALMTIGPVALRSNAAPETPASGVTGLPIFSYTRTNTTPLPWDATALKFVMNGTTMAGSPFVSLTPDGNTLIAWRVPTGTIMASVLKAGGVYRTLCIQCQSPLIPTAASDPVVIYDAQNQMRVLFLTASGHLVIVSAWGDPNLGITHFRSATSDTTWTWRDLTAFSGATFAAMPSVVLRSASLAIAGRTTANHFVLLRTPLQWRKSPSANDIRDLTTVTNDGGIKDSPQWIPGTNTAIVTVASGHITQYRLADDCFSVPLTCSAVTTQDITQATGSPVLVSKLSLTPTTTGVALAGLSATGVATVVLGTGSSGIYTWNDIDISTPSSAPSLDGDPFITRNGTTIYVAAKARNWGDLFILSNETGPNTWKSVDVSITGGSDARTVGGGIAGIVNAGSLTLYAGGVATPPPTGTGLYAIPQNKNSAALADGWPSIGITGGLGTMATPWVAVKSTTYDIKNSQDFLVGKAIADSHKRSAWLSFWTVSGPVRGEKVTPDVYYNHAFASGVAVAATIGKYRAAGLGLKPDWVIIDPEGYPDLHSCLDGVNTIAPWCPAWSPKLWAAYANGWADGLASIDTTLKPGIYASQNEYKLGGMSALTMPVFAAVAFKWFSTSLSADAAAGASSVIVKDSSGLYAGQKFYFRDSSGAEFTQIANTYNGRDLIVPLVAPLKKTHASKVVVNGISPPLRLSTTKGSNLIGYIAFGSSNACLAVPWQIQLFNSAPWSGLYNTLQFDGGVYCRPTGN